MVAVLNLFQFLFVSGDRVEMSSDNEDTKSAVPTNSFVQHRWDIISIHRKREWTLITYIDEEDRIGHHMSKKLWFPMQYW